jgi:hypothetical protein
MLKPVRLNKNLTVDKTIFDFLSNNGDHFISAIILNIDTNSDIGYIGAGDSGDNVTYLPMSKFKDCPEFNPWEKKSGRQSAKIGRFIKKLISKEHFETFKISNTHLESFVNAWKSWFEKVDYVLKVVSGDEIRFWYDESNYAKVNGCQTGTLWKSCMRHRARLSFLDLYTKNPNCKMLVMIINQDGREVVRSRALLWSDVKVSKSYSEDFTPDVVNIMDRIYTTHDSDVTLFKKWADESGYIPKWEQNSKSHLFFDIKSQPVKIKCIIDLPFSKFEYYPYLDTFPYFNSNNKQISNDPYSFKWEYILVQSTGGLEPEEVEDTDDQEVDW